MPVSLTHGAREPFSIFVYLCAIRTNESVHDLCVNRFGDNNNFSRTNIYPKTLNKTFAVCIVRHVYGVDVKSQRLRTPIAARRSGPVGSNCGKVVAVYWPYTPIVHRSICLCVSGCSSCAHEHEHVNWPSVPLVHSVPHTSAIKFVRRSRIHASFDQTESSSNKKNITKQNTNKAFDETFSIKLLERRKKTEAKKNAS